jgi:hypothetical protein
MLLAAQFCFCYVGLYLAKVWMHIVSKGILADNQTTNTKQSTPDNRQPSIKQLTPDNQHPTPRNQLQPPTATADNQQLTPDNQYPTPRNHNYCRLLHPTIKSNTWQPTANIVSCKQSTYNRRTLRNTNIQPVHGLAADRKQNPFSHSIICCRTVLITVYSTSFIDHIFESENVNNSSLNRLS